MWLRTGETQHLKMLDLRHGPVCTCVLRVFQPRWLNCFFTRNIHLILTEHCCAEDDNDVNTYCLLSPSCVLSWPMRAGTVSCSVTFQWPSVHKILIYRTNETFDGSDITCCYGVNEVRICPPQTQGVFGLWGAVCEGFEVLLRGNQLGHSPAWVASAL